RDYEIFVYPRPSYNSEEFQNHPKVSITQTPLMEISSTFIRKAIADGKDVKFFLPDDVIEFIDSKSLYK
ncbi:MAG: nicotinic acid mononucleotide adenylyltransferase, partial [Pelobium sp.]